MVASNLCAERLEHPQPISPLHAMGRRVEVFALAGLVNHRERGSRRQERREVSIST